MLVSAGNFHGQPLAFALDALAMAVSELASISERRVERLVNPNLSDGLPAFLTTDGGLNSGFMIPQYVAASLVSENKSLCHPASVDSIPTSAGQEDHVSMGNASGLKAWQVVANSEHALAIELLAASQAVEFLAPLEPGRGARATHDVRPLALPAAARRSAARARTSRRSRTRSATARCSPPSKPKWGSSNDDRKPRRLQWGVPERRRRSIRTATRCSSTRCFAVLIVVARVAHRRLVAKAAAVAVVFYVVASAWSMSRWRQRLREEAERGTRGDCCDRRRLARRARRVALRRPLGDPRAARHGAERALLGDRGAATDAAEQPRRRGRRTPGGSRRLRRQRQSRALARSAEGDRAALLELGDDETLLVQSGKPVAVFRTTRAVAARADRQLAARPEVGDVGRVPAARGRGADDVRPDDRRLVDLHRHAGDPAGHVPDVRGGGAEALRHAVARRAARS